MKKASILWPWFKRFAVHGSRLKESGGKYNNREPGTVNRVKLWISILTVALQWSVVAYANGYKIIGVKSAKANSLGEAFIAQADDPSAISFNPAGLARLRGEQVNAQASAVNSYVKHTAPSGETTRKEERWEAVPSLFATSDLDRDDMAVGLGVSFPSGFSSEWSDDSFARYVITYANLIVADINPAFGMRVGKQLLIGGGMNLYYSDATLENMLDLGMAKGTPGAMDVKSELTGDGTAWSFNAGGIYEVNSRHSVAATYHHAYSIDYDGQIVVGGVGNDITASLDFPSVVVAGYAFKPSDKLTIELNADWTYWDDVGDIAIAFDAPGAMSDSALKQDLNNTIAYKAGAQYRLSEKLALRCGYIRNHNATPEENWRPSLVDTDAHFLTTGIGYGVNNLTLDAALQIVLFDSRNINNNVDNNETISSSSIDGRYEGWGPTVSVGATYRFQ